MSDVEGKDRRVDFTTAIKRYIHFLDFVTLFTLLVLMLVSARLIYNFLNFTPHS